MYPEEKDLDYKLKEGQSYQFNCVGRIFIEPEHPYYEAGKEYEFLLIRISEDRNILDEKTYSAWLRDVHGKEWECRIDKPLSVESGISSLKCRVDRIKKARLFLSQTGLHISKAGLQ
ncbi:MAG: hypothetical protein J7L96_03775 [Bacteroidales bacterium]|nr:hypothetical protein [Bacteroidales bacterium]